MKKMRKFFAAVFSLAMLLTMIPATAFAAEGDTEVTVGSSGIVVDKTATLTDDGTYTIDLTAYATGATTTTTTTTKSGVPLDIILVLDQSGSMEGDNLTNLKKAANDFIASIKANAAEFQVDHRIAVVGFAGATYGNGSNSEFYYANSELFVGRTQYNYTRNGKESTYNNDGNLAANHYIEAFQTVTSEAGEANLTVSIDSLAAKGGTHPEVGLDMANGIFEANSNTYEKADGTTGTRKRIVVMFTDGTPGDNGFDNTVANDTIKNAYTAKKTYGATVYTVGLLSNPGNNVTNFLNYVSSNYPDAQSMSATSETVYTPVYTLDEGETYYVGGNGYTAVTYGNYRTLNGEKLGWHSQLGFLDFATGYEPKTSENDTSSNHVQFYEKSTMQVGGPGDRAAEKYYMTTSNSAELGEIFENISNDSSSESSETTVTLDENSVLKDIMANGLKMTNSSTITVTTVAGTTEDGKTIAEGEAIGTDLKGEKSTDMTTATVTGFDYSSKYIAKNHPGEILKVQITGVIPSDESVTNDVINTNDTSSGIYAWDKENGKLADTAAVYFPVPKTILTSKAYVLDYAKPVQLSLGDVKLESGTAYGSFAQAGVNANYGSLDGWKYTPKTTKWDGYDSFYAFGTTTDATVTAASANANGNLWSRISVLPANNVYYEDDFVKNDSIGTVGIEYTGSWETTNTNSVTTADPVSENGNNSVHGWEDALADDTEYSDGSVHFSSANGAKATFTFTGTGVDIYSRTNLSTGTVAVTLVGNQEDGTRVAKGFSISNKANSGDYYQIPTFTWSGDYGTYTVTVTVTNAAADQSRSTYYLDGIRVYNPIKNQENDEIVKEAYGDDELKAVFTEARGALKDNTASGTAFVDEVEGEAVERSYTDADVSAYAPEHEVYLAAGQAIVFTTDKNASNSYYIGLKAPADEAKVAFSNGSDAAVTTIGHASDLYYIVTPDENGQIVVRNAWDSEDKDNEHLLSITKLRTTGSGNNGLQSSSEGAAVTAVRLLKAAPVVEYNAAPATDEELTEQETPEITEPETTEPEITDSEETVTEEPGEVIIENPEVPEETVDETPTAASNSWVNNLFSSIRNIFGRR